MKKGIVKNYIYNLTYQLLVLILPLITTPYLSRVLGAEAIGIYSYTLSITTYFILLGSLGVAMYGQREIAYAQHDINKRSKAFFEIIIFRCITMFVGMVIFYMVFIRQGEYSNYYKILLLELLANCIDISWFFQGLEEFKKTVIRNMFVKIISVICIFIFVKSPNDLQKYFMIYSLSILFGNLTLWLYLPKYIKKCKLKELKIFSHFKPTISLFLPQIATQIYTVLDKTMIGTIVIDKSEVGFYEQAQKMIKMFLTIITSFGTVMVPRMAAIYINGEKQKIKEYMKKSFNFVWIISIPMMFGIMSVANKFVPLFYGDGYDKVSILMCVISPIIIIIGMSNVIGTQYLIPTKHQKEYTISVISGAGVNFIFNLIFINLYGAIGASIATVLAELTVTGIQMFFIRREINVKQIIRISKRYFIIGIIMYIISAFIGKIISNNLTSIIIQCLIGICVYVIGLIISKDEFLFQGIKVIKNKLLKSEELV